MEPEEASLVNERLVVAACVVVTAVGQTHALIGALVGELINVRRVRHALWCRRHQRCKRWCNRRRAFNLARDLDSPSEASICEVLKARLLSGQIYTGMSAMLLAVNPCEWLPGLYSDGMLQRYLGSDCGDLSTTWRVAVTARRRAAYSDGEKSRFGGRALGGRRWTKRLKIGRA